MWVAECVVLLQTLPSHDPLHMPEGSIPRRVYPEGRVDRRQMYGRTPATLIFIKEKYTMLIRKRIKRPINTQALSTLGKHDNTRIQGCWAYCNGY